MGKRIRYLTVDDEPAARRKLKRMLATFPVLEYAGEAGDIAGAVSLVGEEAPDLLFLDIKLSAENGFDLLNQLPRPVHVVFITAFDEFALSAFEASALDYLMKPVHPERLQQCIEKVEYFLSNVESRCLVLKDISGRMQRVHYSDISMIKADGDYTLVYSSAGQFMVRRTVKSWLEELPHADFIKLSRSLVLNRHSVVTVQPVTASGARVRLTGHDADIGLSRTEWVRLKDHL